MEVRVIQLRPNDKVVVLEFREDDNIIGSRGITLSDEEFNAIMSMSLFVFAKLFQGVKYEEIESLSNSHEALAVFKSIVDRAYRELLGAKAEEEQERASIIDESRLRG